MISSDIIRKHFRPISARKVHELEVNINSVIDSDGKPAYLVDAVSPKQDQLELLIKEVNNNRDRSVSLLLIIIDNEDYLEMIHFICDIFENFKPHLLLPFCP